jgi:hypothetical protein
MTEVNTTWNLETLPNTTRAETAAAATGRGGRLRLRLDEAIGEMDVHLYRCEACLVHGNELCCEGADVRDEVDLARSALLRFELRPLPVPRAFARLRVFALRPNSV